MVRSTIHFATAGLGILLALSFGCTHDTYQQRADIVKDHVEAFYSHLKTNHVEAAVRENEQIEAMAGQMGRLFETGTAARHHAGGTGVCVDENGQ